MPRKEIEIYGIDKKCMLKYLKDRKEKDYKHNSNLWVNDLTRLMNTGNC